MKRRLLNLLAALSLLLLATVAASWVLSYLPEEFELRSHEGRVLLIFSARQWVNLFDPEGRLSTDEVLQTIEGFASQDTSARRLRVAGFEAIPTDRHSGFWLFAVPHWAAALPPAGAAGWALWLGRRPARRKARGLCAACGYDLRGSTERCPECGTVPGPG